MLYRLFIGILILLAGLGVYKGITLSRQQAGKPAAPPPLAEPARSPFKFSIAATGIIESARENVKVATSKPGLVTKVHATVGASVKTGDPLFQIDGREAIARTAAIEAQIAVEAASLAADQVLLAEATDQLNRVSRTGSAKFITEDEIQRRRFAVQSNEARVARSTAALEAARVQLREARTELDVLTVRASRDGRILQLNLREGEYANANPPEPLMVLGDTDTLQIRADVDEQNAPMVEPGRAATASIKGNAANRFPLKFVRIDPFVLPKKSLTGDSTERVDTRVLQVIFSLEKPAHQQLYVGQQVDVYIEISEPKPDAATSTAVPGSGTL
jgi:RND family efflux transporter MFP subunit